MKIIYTWPWFLNSYISTLILFLHSPFAAGFGLTQHCGQFLNFSSKRHSFNWIQSSVDSLNYLSSLGGDGVTLIPTRLLLIHLYKRLYQIGRARNGKDSEHEEVVQNVIISVLWPAIPAADSVIFDCVTHHQAGVPITVILCSHSRRPPQERQPSYTVKEIDMDITVTIIGACFSLLSLLRVFYKGTGKAAGRDKRNHHKTCFGSLLFCVRATRNWSLCCLVLAAELLHLIWA